MTRPSLTPKVNFTIKTKWDLLPLGSITEVVSGGTPDTDIQEYWDDGEICWATIVDTKQKHISDTVRKITPAGLKNSSAKLLPVNTVIFSSRATIGEVAINIVPLATNQGFKNFICNEEKITYQYLYYLLVSLKNVFEMMIPSGTKYKEINTTDISSFRIPVPPLDIQRQVVSECQKIDDRVEEAKDNIKDLSHLIEKAINEYYRKSYPIKKLNDFAVFNPSKSEVSSRQDNLEVSFVEMSSVNENGYIDYKEDRLLKDVKQGSYKYFAENDIIIAKITPCMENGKCAIATGLINNIGFGSSEFHVIRIDNEVSSSDYVFAFLNRETIRLEAEKHMTGSSGHRRVPASFYQNLEIPLPSLDEQTKLVSEVNKLQDRISQAQAIIDKSTDKKHAIIQSYL